MLTKDYHFSFTAHALERGLERIFNIDAPYSAKQLNKVKEFIVLNMEWNAISCKWVLDDYELELIIRNHTCITIVPYDNMGGVKPVSDYMKKYSKKRKHQGNYRNSKSKDKDWRR